MSVDAKDGILGFNMVLQCIGSFAAYVCEEKRIESSRVSEQADILIVLVSCCTIYCGINDWFLL